MKVGQKGPTGFPAFRAPSDSPVVCFQKDAMWIHVPKTDEKDQSKSKACNFMNVGDSTASRSSHDLRVSGGVFLSLYHTTARDRKSRRFNRDGGTSLKPIMHGLRSLHFCAGALNGFDIPWWITTTKWEGERQGGSSKKAREQEAERENPGGILCLKSLGAFSVLVEYCTFLWQAYLLSSTHASLSNRMKSQRRSSFIQPECACSCVAHLLLIKQWQATKTLFDRDCGN